MWRRWLILSLVLYKHTSSQPITEDSDHVRVARQYDFVECCPCPSSRYPARSVSDLARSATDLLRGEDCPCRPRDADSDRSPSILLPRTLTPLVNFVTPVDLKEDPKPLLHPEVGLASSFLETLREATDEEYEEALERDAARSAARASEPDGPLDDIPDSAKNIVTIIVNPKSTEEDEKDAAKSAAEASKPNGPLDDGTDATKNIVTIVVNPNLTEEDERGTDRISERASEPDGPLNEITDVDENIVTIIVNPKSTEEDERDVARSAERTSEPVGSLDDITDAAKKIVTIIVNPKSTEEDGILPEASNVQEIQVRAVPPNLLKGFLPRPENTLMSRLFDMNNTASTIKERVESINKGLEGLKLRANPKLKLSSTVKTLENTNLNKLKLDSKIPDLRLRPLEITKPLVDIRANKLNKLAIPKLKLNNARKNGNFDNNLSPSNRQEQFLDSSEKIKSQFKLMSILPLPPIKPLNLKKLLNLKDVELIPPKSNKAKLIQPNKEDSNGKEAAATNIQVIAKDKSINTEILDAVPSPSENHQVLTEVDASVETTAVNLEEDTKSPDPCIPQFHETEGGENYIIGISKEISQDNDIETIISEGESSETENIDMQQANQESIEEDMNVKEQTKEGQGSDLAPAASSPQLDIQEIGSFDYVEVDSEDKKTGNAKQIPNTDFVRKDYVDNVDNNQDSMIGAISNIEQIIPHEISKEVIDGVSDESTLNGEDCHLVEEEDIVKSKIPPMSVEDSHVTGLAQAESLETQEDEGKTVDSSIKTECDLDSQSKASTISQATDTLSEDKLEDEEEDGGEYAEELDHVNIHDLQQLSDSLLEQSNMNKQNEIVNAVQTECNATDADESSMKLKEQDTENTSIVDSSDEEIESSDLNPAASSLDTQILETISRPTISLHMTSDNSEIPKAVDGIGSGIKTCTIDLDSSKNSAEPQINVDNSKSIDNDESQDLLDVEATTPLVSIRQMALKSSEDNTPGSSIRQNVVVQPSSLVGGNGLDIFRRPIASLPDLLHLNTNIPTLEQIQTSFSNLFGTQERDADEDELSGEFDSDIDGSHRNSVMSTDASTRSSNTMLPTLKPLEDINIDIFQLNPLSQSSPLTSKLPVFNLNSYKAKLAIPKTLDLKPMKFESALGNKGGLLGATFSVGPKKIGFTRKPKPVTNSGSPFNNKPIILGNPLSSLPTFDDLKMKMNTQSSFNTNTRLNPLEDPFRTSQTISDNLRAHTENTMKNIQQSLASTLSETRVRDSDLLSSKLPTPQDLLEKVTLAQDDMNDKLKAIHYDLNDRLTSWHESIVDQTRLPSLSTPNVKSSPLKFTTKPQSKDRGQNKQTSSVQLNSSGMPLKKPAPRVNKPQTNLRLNSPGSPPNRKQTLKPFRMSTAASSLTPKSVEVPTLTTIPRTTSFSGLQRDPNVKLKESKSSLFAPKEQKKTKKYNRPNLMKHFKPFGETQVKVSFSTTPRPSTQLKAKPVTTARPTFTSRSMMKNEKLTTIPRSSPIRSRPSVPQHKFKSADSKGHGSVFVPSIIPAPEKHITKPAGKVDTTLKGSQLRASKIPKETKLNRVVPSKTAVLTNGANIIENKPFKLGGNVQSWPTTTESAFLSKVREALKSRFSSVSPSTTTEPIVDKDMTRSASENNELVVLPEPMKENVPYKCKMVCVREP